MKGAPALVSPVGPYNGRPFNSTKASTFPSTSVCNLQAFQTLINSFCFFAFHFCHLELNDCSLAMSSLLPVLLTAFGNIGLHKSCLKASLLSEHSGLEPVLF